MTRILAESDTVVKLTGIARVIVPILAAIFTVTGEPRAVTWAVAVGVWHGAIIQGALTAHTVLRCCGARS